jgi:cysteine desulfurase
MERIYLDHAATTPLHPKAREAMAPWMSQEFGNPSSLYAEGRKARHAVDEARETVGRLLGCDFGEVIFTSSGTEAANLAILGAAIASKDGPRKRILMGASEHHAVLHTTSLLQALGFRVQTVDVDRFASLQLGDLQSKLSEDVLLVCLMHANNELGTLQPVVETSEMAHNSGALFFCDAVQTFCALPWTVDDIGADLVAISAHKTYGPKGAGALYVRAGTPFKPVTVGGGQERELRAGTENVAAIVGFAAAAQAVSSSDSGAECARDVFLEATVAGGARRSVPAEIECLTGHAHLRFPGLSAESMLILLDRLGVSASSGAACSSGSLEPSHVLLAAGYSEAEAKEGLRFTFGRDSALDQAREAARRVLEAAETVRR